VQPLVVGPLGVVKFNANCEICHNESSIVATACQLESSRSRGRRPQKRRSVPGGCFMISAERARVGFSPPASRRWSPVNLQVTGRQRCSTATRSCRAPPCSRRRRKSRCSENRHSSGIVCTKMQQGLAGSNRKPFILFLKLVAGVRFELTAIGL
jgi:hypothetical protein